KQSRRIARPAQPCRRIADELRTAHDAVDGQRKGARRAGQMSRPGCENTRSEYAAKTRGKRHEKVYNLLNQNSPPNVYCSEQRQDHSLFSWSSQQCVWNT